MIMAFSGPPLRLAPPDPADTVEKQEATDFARKMLQENIDNSRYSLLYIQQSYKVVFGMYIFLFLVGLGTAITAIIKGFLAHSGTDTFSTLIFAGLSAASFFTLFISRPLDSLERNTFFSSWVIAVVNNYWTKLAYLNDPDKMGSDLQDATNQLITELSNLADKYAAAIGKYPALITPSQNGNDPAKVSGGNPPPKN